MTKRFLGLVRSSALNNVYSGAKMNQSYVNAALEAGESMESIKNFHILEQAKVSMDELCEIARDHKQNKLKACKA